MVIFVMFVFMTFILVMLVSFVFVLLTVGPESSTGPRRHSAPSAEAHTAPHTHSGMHRLVHTAGLSHTRMHWAIFVFIAIKTLATAASGLATSVSANIRTPAAASVTIEPFASTARTSPASA
jgi:hypothetical protein